MSNWTWPLAAAIALAALSIPPVRRRWPQPARRIALAIGIFAGLVGLASHAVRWPGEVLIAVSLIVAVGLSTAWVLVVPRRLAPPVTPAELEHVNEGRDRLEVRDGRAKLRNDVRTTATQGIVGLAVLAGAVLGFQQLADDREQARATQDLTRLGQASDRFTVAINQLGSLRREVQLGGIYGLEQVAQQAPVNRLAVSEVLAGYLHRRIPRAAKLPADPASASEFLELRIRVPDAQAALTVLGRRQTAESDPALSLRTLDLRNADLVQARFRHADLRGGDLRDAKLNGADLFDAGLGGAILRRAILEGANLRKAILGGADLDGAHLGGAYLSGADLNADLSGADLSGAYLGGADLSRAVLDGADLRGADLGGADLSYAYLSKADLREAIDNPHTTWPKGFDQRGAGVLPEP